MKAKGLLLNDIKGLVVRHKCDNTRCINPDHLIIGTHADNVQDKVDRNRQARGADHGQAQLSAEQVKSLREEYVFGSKEAGTYALARKYGVSQRAVYMVVNHITWKEGVPSV